MINFSIVKYKFLKSNKIKIYNNTNNSIYIKISIGKYLFQNTSFQEFLVPMKNSQIIDLFFDRCILIINDITFFPINENEKLIINSF